MSQFWQISTNVQIALALFLIVVLLMYVAYQTSKKSRR